MENKLTALGRVHVEDTRDTQYPMSLHLPKAPALPMRKMWRSQVPRLDQGNIGACVGFTGANWLGALPLYNRVTDQTGLDLYYACKKIDGIPDEEGTYDRALAKVLVSQGRISRYLWAQNPDDLRTWVLTTGPVMVGTNWYESMFDPAPDAHNHLVLDVSGSIAGGHEYLVRGYDTRSGMYRVRNSWGKNWADNGEVWIKESDLYRLVFSEQGDALGAVEQRPS